MDAATPPPKNAATTQDPTYVCLYTLQQYMGYNKYEEHSSAEHAHHTCSPHHRELEDTLRAQITVAKALIRGISFTSLNQHDVSRAINVPKLRPGTKQVQLEAAEHPACRHLSLEPLYTLAAGRGVYAI